MSNTKSEIEIDVPSPLRECFLHSETICVRECCGIDAISDDPELVAAWGRTVGYQQVRQALKQVEQLITQVEDRVHKIVFPFFNAHADGEVTRGQMLSFLRAFETALRSRPMNEVLTRAEMEAQFNGEWVLVADPELDKNLEVLSGRVIYHGADRDTMYQEATNQQITRWASLYFGPVPDMSVLLNIWV